jgi:VWFA-related protein
MFRLAFACGLVSAALAQTPPAKPEQEMASKDAPAVFTSRVNLVPVTVVVRDSSGHAIGDLKKEDFRLLDNGKPQEITKFSIEKPDSPIILEKDSSEPGEVTKPQSAQPVIATRFTAFLFDDLHAVWEDLVRSRDAAARYLSDGFQPTDRVAIYSTSGQTMLEFTSDLDKLHDTLQRIQPRRGPRATAVDCPMLSYYMGDQIENKNDTQALQAAENETLACAGLDPTKTPPSVLESMARASARRALTLGEEDTRLALRVLSDVTRRMAAAPGQRTVILASPGFLLPFLHHELTEVITRAIRANVIVNCLDARGLWAPPGFSAADPSTPGGAFVSGIKSQYARMEAIAQEDVMVELASGTGGSYIHNTNDLSGGFRRLATAPEFLYVLGFTPSTLKADGKFHKLTVSLRETKGLTLQARRGYYAPKHEEDAAAQAKQEIEATIFSREVLKEIPVRLHTQFFKPSAEDAKVAVMAQIDLKQLRYRKENGRNRNTVMVVSALFDPGGNYVAGVTKQIDLMLLDETLAKKLGSPVTVKTNFDVKPGSYVVRLVVRDTEGQMMAAENAALEIP